MITLKGFLQHKRNISKILFLIIRDNEKLFQITVKSPLILELDHLNKESYLEFKVIRNLDSSSVLLDYDLISYEIINQCETNVLPFALNLPNKLANIDKSTIDDFKYFYLKNDDCKQTFINKHFNIKTLLIHFFNKRLFNDTSKLSFVSPEGGSLFEVNDFDKKLYLVQSPQVSKQMLVTSGFEKIYEMNYVYRAESSDTPRHLAIIIYWLIV